MKKIPPIKTQKPDPEEGRLNSVKIREEYNLDEINTLLDQINGAMCEYKANQVGNDPSQMVKTVRGGKVVWITIDEMNEILRKQKRIVFKKTAKRETTSKHAISEEILSRLQIAKYLVETIKLVNETEYPGYLKKYRFMESNYYQANSLSRDIQILDNAILRKKKEDPLLQEMEGTTAEMIEAMKGNNLSTVDACQSFYNRNADDYAVRHKLLEPYIKKANETRLAYLRTKQKTVESEYLLYEDGFTFLSSFIEEIIRMDQEGEMAQAIVSGVVEVKALLDAAKTAFLQTTSIPENELENNKAAFNAFDKEHLSAIVTRSAGVLDQLRQAWQKLICNPERKHTECTVRVTQE